jgi:ABC-type branched-subunit amino acid transport system substrate-binding protein
MGATQPAAAIPVQKPSRIAMLLPLGGFDQSAMIAKAMKQAGEMAIFELDNPMVQLVVKDDRGSPEGAEAAAREAISEGAEIVLGPLYSRSVPAAASVTRAAGVPLVSFSNDRLVAGNGVYLMSYLAEPEVDRIVSYAVSQGRRRFAALIPADPYGPIVEPLFRAAVQRAGGTVAAVETYPLQANAMVAPVKRLAATIAAEEKAGQPIDALFLPAGPDQLPQLAPLLAYSGIDTARVKLLGTGAWDHPSLAREQALSGAWYPSPDPKGFQDFSQRFTRTFGTPPPRIASLAYDAVAAAISLSSAPPGQRFSAATLLRPQGFGGVDGTVRFTGQGTAERSLAILELQPYGARVIDAQPADTAGPLTATLKPNPAN